MQDGDQLICDFCGDSEEEVDYMVASPSGACICDDCIGEVVLKLEEMENTPIGPLH